MQTILGPGQGENRICQLCLLPGCFGICDRKENPYICTSCKERIYDRDGLLIHECKEIKSPFNVHKHIFWEG